MGFTWTVEEEDDRCNRYAVAEMLHINFYRESRDALRRKPVSLVEKRIIPHCSHTRLCINVLSVG